MQMYSADLGGALGGGVRAGEDLPCKRWPKRTERNRCAASCGRLGTIGSCAEGRQSLPYGLAGIEAEKEYGAEDGSGSQDEEERAKGQALVTKIDAVAGAEIALNGRVPERLGVMLDGFQR